MLKSMSDSSEVSIAHVQHILEKLKSKQMRDSTLKIIILYGDHLTTFY